MDENRTVMVTGGAEGIGACTAHMLSRSGFRVLFCDIDAEKGRMREKQLRDGGNDVRFIHCDVSSSRSVGEMARAIRESGEHLHAIVSNAGIADPAMSFPSESDTEWERVIGTNLTGSYLIVNALVDLISRNGSIVLVSSTRALQSEPGTLAYSASKGGLLALAHSLALTLSGRRIRVNSILPGWIDTSGWKLPPRKEEHRVLDHEQHPSGRIGEPEDVAKLIRFLVGDDSSWINGESITIDGGMTKRMIYFDDEVLDEANRMRGKHTG